MQELLGAYALGAVDEREREAIEAHLETCESCRVELDDHSRLAESLRRHASRMSPLASVESNGSARTNGPAEARQRRWTLPVAMAIVLVLLGALFARSEIRLNDLGTAMRRVELLERALVAAAAPGAVVTPMITPRNEPVVTVVSGASGGESYAIITTLPRLAKGETYQLWRTGIGGVAPAVALGRQPDTAVFSLPPGVSELVLTVERVPAPTQPMLPAVATGRVVRPPA